MNKEEMQKYIQKVYKQGHLEGFDSVIKILTDFNRVNKSLPDKPDPPLSLIIEAIREAREAVSFRWNNDGSVDTMCPIETKTPSKGG